MRVRRRRKIGYVVAAVFAAVFLFTFLMVRSRGGNETVGAANLGVFDPGYIISDWQMANYESMSEAEIQKFLTAKNSCGETSHEYYLQLKQWNPGVNWHYENGHFVCLSEERFGDGEAIGSGETAARIIWRAAQDYRINPQVLIVLLQKETGLITDPIPNNYDYRKATGYGCPDTAPCSAEYYGLKNQIRHAAALFRAVLDGGWTNYPLGDNYVQYNPDRDCGGTTVNIRSLATSALYRYTPYQPNAAALAAGYGYGDYCSAYGNRNFYSYFEDWFGGVTGGSTISYYYSIHGDELGEAVTDEVCGLTKGGCYRVFEGGYVYWSADGGARVIDADLFDYWFSTGTEWGTLGYPMSDVMVTSDGGKRQVFEGGTVYWTAGTGAWSVSGKLYDVYQKEGSEWGILGYPTSSEQKDANGVVYQTFEGGAVYWNGKPWVIREFSVKKWEQLGGTKSKLGMVTGTGVCGITKDGCYQPFETGNIYWTAKTGAWDVSGGIYQEYLNNGTEWGILGYPTSSEQKDANGVVYQTFEGGAVYWENGHARVSLY